MNTDIEGIKLEDYYDINLVNQDEKKTRKFKI